jgi:hypothetical protein
MVAKLGQGATVLPQVLQPNCPIQCQLAEGFHSGHDLGTNPEEIGTARTKLPNIPC